MTCSDCCKPIEDKGTHFECDCGCCFVVEDVLPYENQSPDFRVVVPVKPGDPE